jgi:pyruvate,water dikinase
MDEAQPLRELLGKVAAEFEVAMGRPDEVRALCARLREALGFSPGEAAEAVVRDLALLLQKRMGAIAVPVFELLEEQVARNAAPWPLVEGLLLSRDTALARRALGLTEALCKASALTLDAGALRFLAAQADQAGSPLAQPEALATIAGLLRGAGGDAPSDAVTGLYLDSPDPGVRRLAARLLDLDGQPAAPEIAERVLGREAHGFLGPYLRYTRASHLDLLHLAAEPGAAPPVLASLRRAEALCGEAPLRKAIAELGWARVNLGVEVRAFTAVRFGGALPLMVSPAEASLLDPGGHARRSALPWLIVAHGGQPALSEARGSDKVDRFRSYNLAHAAALADILDVAPLTREKVARILERMDRIVEDFVAIFAAHAEECAVLPGLYRELRARVVSELEKEGAPVQLSAELTRLVQAFEDPRSLGEVRTLHGLKRYLHQRGLRLGFRLVEAGGATNRTVDLVLASRTRALRRLRRIAYVDFEPETALAVPYAVRLLVEAFARQLLHGHESFPSAQVFCYGNEVHYYLAFKNHPAFLRIDYSPPLAGGMIDLEYYGVSVYELSAHPAPSLEALRRFFRALEFDIRVDGTRVHARYDKERALDLGDVCEKAEMLCCLAPYLMDLDWVIGSLRHDAEARRRVGEAWAESFAEWGVLPLRGLLSHDRQAVLEDLETGPAGEREVAWSGAEPYMDRFRVAPPEGLRAHLQQRLRALGLETAPLDGVDPGRLIGQMQLERQVLRPLRAALDCGAVVAAEEGFRRSPDEIFERRHEAEVFAELLASGEVAPAAGLARLVAPLERALRFRGTGRVNGHDVQRARLALRGEPVGLHVLRDPGGIIRLAVFARGEILGRHREDPSRPWHATWSVHPAELAALLRRNGYLAPGAEPGTATDAEARETLALFQRPCPARGPRPLPGERVLQGFRASPGRAVGRALFGSAGRVPTDLDGAVLVAPSVSPEDNTFLYHARGIVSTGGGILSHAGLIATQFGKPALVVAGRWQRERDGSATLLYRTPEYREDSRRTGGSAVTVFRDWHEREHALREGDLVVLDALAGTLKVLGQDRDALALHEELWRFGAAGRRLARADDVQELLALRGGRVRAAHQVRKLLGRIGDALLARHAAHELLAGEALAGEGSSSAERADLLGVLLANPATGQAALDYVRELVAELAERYADRLGHAGRRIPTAGSAHEVLAQWLDAVHLGESLEEARAALVGSDVAPPGRGGGSGVDALARERLRELYEARLRELATAPPHDPRLRHLLRQVERLGGLLEAPPPQVVRQAREALALRDEAAREASRGRLILTAAEAGFELHPQIGWKAANLGEVTRLAGAQLVPPFFVVTDRAFEQVFEAPLARIAPGVEGLPPGAGSLREAVAAILARGDLDHARQSARIRALWDAVRLPDGLAREVVAAYRGLAPQGPEAAGQAEEGASFVAIRSSAREEDAELAARAGEFETFLFVRGEDRVLECLKRAWSGLWTERAIHNRALLETGEERTGGGVVVQRIVWSRVSGVLQTVNVAEAEPREIVVNVGLGLGEGIVSGAVAADHVVVAKEGDLERGPLRFRYVTADKREQVGFDRRAGFGTSRLECLYHQRLRPALEYVELCELVAITARLEAAYGYPLDIEFGIEGQRLFILQARPVATFLSLLREAGERRPPRAAVAAETVAAGEVRS